MINTPFWDEKQLNRGEGTTSLISFLSRSSAPEGLMAGFRHLESLFCGSVYHRLP
jgi:hypothetical protein